MSPSCPQDRDNSPSSCAGLFIASHIGFDWPGVWVHLDIAAPVHAVSASGMLLKARRYTYSCQTHHVSSLQPGLLPPSYPVPAEPLWLRAASEIIRKVLCCASDCLWPSLQPAVVSLTSSLFPPGNRVAALVQSPQPASPGPLHSELWH